MRRYGLAISFALCLIARWVPAQSLPHAPSGPRARVQVIAFDSLFDLRPLPRAEVLLESDTGSALGVTNDSGRVWLDVTAGTRYRVTFFHPRLERLGLSGKVKTVVVASDTTIMLSTPAGVQVQEALCGTDTTREFSVLMGTVEDSAASAVGGALVRVGWRRWTVEGTRLVPTTDARETRTNSAGRYTLCGVPSDGVLTWRVTARGRDPLLAYVNAKARPVVELSARFLVAQSELTGSAAAPRANELDATLVTARANEDRTGFERRRLTAPSGTFLTAEDIERRRAVATLDVFRGIVGINVVPACGGMCSRILFGRFIGGRGAEGEVCQPVVFVDGVRLPDEKNPSVSHALDYLVSPSDIMGIEIYKGPAAIPAAYASKGSECGAVLVWTKLRR